MSDYSRAWLGYPDPAFVAYPWPSGNSWGSAELIFLRAQICYRKSVVDDNFATLNDEALACILKCLPHDTDSSKSQEKSRKSDLVEVSVLRPDSRAFYEGIGRIVDLLNGSIRGTLPVEVKHWRTLDAAIDIFPCRLQLSIESRKKMVLSIEAWVRSQRERRRQTALAAEQGLQDDSVAAIWHCEDDPISDLEKGTIKTRGKKPSTRARKKQKLAGSKNKMNVDTDKDISGHEEPSPLSLAYLLRRPAPLSVALTAAQWKARTSKDDCIGHLLKIIIVVGGFSDVFEYSDQVVEHCISFQHGLRPFSGIKGPAFKTEGCIRLSAELENTNALPLIHIERGSFPGAANIELPINFAAQELASMLAILQNRVEHAFHKRTKPNIGTVFTIGVYGRKAHITRIKFNAVWSTAIKRQRFDRKDNPHVVLEQTKWFRLDRKEELHEFSTMIYRILSQLRDDVLLKGRRF